MQAEILAKQAQVDELERYLDTLTDILAQQSDQLASQKKFVDGLGLQDDLQTSYRIEVQAFNQAKKFTAEPVRDNIPIDEQLQKCIDYLYNFVLEINLFAKRVDDPEVERMLKRLQQS